MNQSQTFLQQMAVTNREHYWRVMNKLVVISNKTLLQRDLLTHTRWKRIAIQIYVEKEIRDRFSEIEKGKNLNISM